jgi:hypothetical protein
MRGHVAQINPRVEQLANIAETGIPKRHITKPERAETQRLRSFGQSDLVEHAGHVPIESLQREKQSKAQMTLSEGPAVPPKLCFTQLSGALDQRLQASHADS